METTISATISSTIAPIATASAAPTGLLSKIDPVSLFAAVCIFLFWATLVYWVWQDIEGRAVDLRWRRVFLFLVTVFNVGGLMIYLVLRPPRSSEMRRAQLEEELLKLEIKRLKKELKG